jgi:hypothetical protein
MQISALVAEIKINGFYKRAPKEDKLSSRSQVCVLVLFYRSLVTHFIHHTHAGAALLYKHELLAHRGTIANFAHIFIATNTNASRLLLLPLMPVCAR